MELKHHSTSPCPKQLCCFFHIAFPNVEIGLLTWKHLIVLFTCPFHMEYQQSGVVMMCQVSKVCVFAGTGGHRGHLTKGRAKCIDPIAVLKELTYRVFLWHKFPPD